MDNQDIGRSLKQLIESSIVDGKMKIRERSDLEFKKSYSEKNHYLYAKIMASFSNREGGYIVFGVTDKYREIIGCQGSYDDFKQEELTSLLMSSFSPEIDWDCGEIDINGKTVWYIYTQESMNKPVMALKEENSAKISSGDIFYRYRAQTTKIKYQELNQIISNNVERTQKNILLLLEKIIQKGQTNIGIVNYSDGTFTTPNGVNVSVDRKLVLQVLKKAKFIKEGSFNQTTGEPVLKITGDLKVAEEVKVPDMNPKDKYPYMQTELAEKLGLINKHHLYALIWKYKLKGDLKFHMAISVSKSGLQETHRFSEEAFIFLKSQLENNKSNHDYLVEIAKEFNLARIAKLYCH